MASISNDGNGHRRILFMAGDGTRRAIRLGKVNQRQAEAFKVKLENLVGGTITGNVDDETSRWLAGLDDAMHAKLAAVGLVTARAESSATVASFIDGYIAGRPDIKPRTRVNLRQAHGWLVKHFGVKRDIHTVTPADAENWRATMQAGGLGENTIRRHTGRARQFFKAAIRRGLYRGENPFAELPCTVRSDKARQFFVTSEVADKVMEACPDAEWRLLFALSRYGGLRCPSEHLSLTWGDVNWEHNRLRVPSPKTAHHEGGECRHIPLFPELRQPLLDVFEQAEPGATFVITRYRQQNANLRTQFNRILRRAGVAAWPKPFHNLRSSRQTELAEKFPIHVVCKWIGNTVAVAQESYLQVNDAHFAAAAMAPETTPNKAAHNPAQYTPEWAGISEKVGTPCAAICAVFPNNSDKCLSVQELVYPRQDSNL